MTFLIGLVAALAGNVVIGAGQCLQKSALNQLQRDNERQHVMMPAYPSQPRPNSKALGRLSSKRWILGLALNYAGEVFGNSLALSYLSAAVVAPLGIVSVIVNLLLAERFLGERMTPNQRFGFIVITAGVGCILLVAPRRPAASTAAEFVALVTSSGIAGVFAMAVLVQAALILLIRSGRQSLFLYVLVASVFGSMNVMASKLLTTFLRLRLAWPALANPADLIFHGAHSTTSHGVSLAQVVAGVAMATSIAGQESFRQQALGRYSVMEFQPVFFATFNVVATLASLLLFRELDSWQHATVFFAVFTCGTAVIIYGARFLPRSRGAVVGLPSHIRLHLESEGLKTL
ncbi:hypothetical protein GGI04_003373 [Coemansia thaxteri]|uniref:Magnesium transporter n=1 Tax=Coemansia thaxteri TaxID=2663907 RepID=A0A9W8EHR9_9FUNG|nr:hypothetical protein GGI04_003373 [Coemansia thaxteri]KAJ2003056.1 hypothetical protein H4R26_003282 [Coemansia thaxteri]KAJ2470000.1 hypothetical protein GGI02_003228 [Coemansia sp. RSA 2322]KAJ2484429.1 hypothetical protein EV174_002443 [Coemansia sp. RSA 2320]